MDINKHIVKNLDFYLDQEMPEYAFLVSGPWGSGKTHFVDEYIRTYASPERTLVKVSLFGLRSTSDVDSKIFQALHPILGHKYTKLGGNILKGAISFGFKIDVNQDGKEDMSATVKPGGLTLSDFMSGKKKDVVLVLDDFERTSIPMVEILGYINYLVEVSNVKVVVVANEGQVLGRKDKYLYSVFKEKVIGKTFEVKHNAEEIIDGFLDVCQVDVLTHFKSIIHEVHVSSGCKNLRKIKQVIYDFKYLCTVIESKYLANEAFCAVLVRLFFALSVEVKTGALQEEDLRRGTPFDKNAKSTEGKLSFYQKYFARSDLIYNGNIWADIIFGGDLGAVNAHTAKLFYFVAVKEKEVAAWDRLRDFKVLDNPEFSRLIPILQKEFTEAQTCELPVYLNKLDLMIYFSKAGLVNVSISIIKHAVGQFIEAHEESDHWKEFLVEAGSNFHGSGRSFVNERDEDFVSLRSLLARRNKVVYDVAHAARVKSAEAEFSTAFFNAIEHGDMKHLSSVMLKEFNAKPLFNKFDPAVFIDFLLVIKSVHLDNFSDLLYARYGLAGLLNNKPYYAYMTDELDFWQTASVALNTHLEALSGVQKHNLRLFLSGVMDYIVSTLSKSY